MRLAAHALVFCVFLGACNTAAPSGDVDRRWASTSSDCDQSASACYAESTSTEGSQDTQRTADDDVTASDDDSQNNSVTTGTPSRQTVEETPASIEAEDEVTPENEDDSDDVDGTEPTADRDNTVADSTEESVDDDFDLVTDEDADDDEQTAEEVVDSPADEATDDEDDGETQGDDAADLPGDGEACELLCAEGLTCLFSGVCRELCGAGLLGEGNGSPSCDPAVDDECCALTEHDQCIEGFVYSWCEPSAG